MSSSFSNTQHFVQKYSRHPKQVYLVLLKHFQLIFSPSCLKASAHDIYLKVQSCGNLNQPSNFLLRMLDETKDRFLGDPDWSSEM